jgi:hypothetical protein
MKTDKLNYNYLAIVAIVICLTGLGYYIFTINKIDNLATCLQDKATFYGAFWCPNCAIQKELFGNSMSKIKYVECSTGEKEPQKEICDNEKIENYPTWIFADGTRMIGTAKLETLALRTGCKY